MAKKFADAGRKVTFAVSDVDDFRHELDEYGLTDAGDKPLIAGRNEKDEKFVMQADFRSAYIGSQPSDHYFRSVCLFVCLFVQSFS